MSSEHYSKPSIGRIDGSYVIDRIGADKLLFSTIILGHLMAEDREGLRSEDISDAANDRLPGESEKFTAFKAA